MSNRYSFLALEEDFQLVLDWFAALPDEMTVDEDADRIAYCFVRQAKAPLPPARDTDPEKTPLAIISKPRRALGSLWTDGEVWFTPVPFKKTFPSLYRTNKAFAAWLASFDLVFSVGKPTTRDWKYFLEGGIQNWDERLYALPKAMEALGSGQYFVHHRDGPARLDAVAKSLRLRGYDVADA